jgi:hypothetical protein
MALATIVANAARTGKESQHVALTCGFLPGLAGVRSLCCWCAEGRPHAQAFRLPRGGECSACPYAGYDCLVALTGAEL